MRYGKQKTAALILFFFSIVSSVRSSEKQLLIYKKKYIMGTVFEIAAYDHSSQHASEAIENAFQEIARIDNLLSNFKPDSDLSRLNRSAHFHTEKVPPELYRVVQEALRLSKLSA